MKASIFPTNYEQWQHCITVECGLDLTTEYICERILALKDEKDYYTQQFVKLYGKEYLAQTISWFLQAEKILAERV